MPLSRRTLLLASLVGGLWPSRGITAEQAQNARHGGTLNYPIHPEPTTLVCFNTTEGPAIQASAKVIEGLLTYDYDLNPQPQLRPCHRSGGRAQRRVVRPRRADHQASSVPP
jgi:peptide/nickel transport system substrate-binding protein